MQCKSYITHCSLQQVAQPTEWKMKDVSTKIRSQLTAPAEEDEIDFGEWRYYIKLPAHDRHQNHLSNEVGTSVIFVMRGSECFGSRMNRL